jgi:hypothetical protein
MTEQDELHLAQFRSDLLKILGEIYAELSTVRKAVRPARLFGEGRVEELMDLIAHLIAECDLNEARLDEMRKEAMAAIGAGEDND